MCTAATVLAKPQDCGVEKFPSFPERSMQKLSYGRIRGRECTGVLLQDYKWKPLEFLWLRSLKLAGNKLSKHRRGLTTSNVIIKSEFRYLCIFSP